MKQERLHFADALRSCLMLLGVVFHTSLVYSTLWHYDVNDPETSVVFDWIFSASRVFRMTAFFMIAGFFALMALEKYDLTRFLKQRIVRIAVPLLFTLCTLNLIYNYLVWSLGTPFSELKFWDSHGHVDLMTFFFFWIRHLWFLVFLIIFSLGALGVRLLLGRLDLLIDWTRMFTPTAIVLGFGLIAMPALQVAAMRLSGEGLDFQTLFKASTDPRAFVGFGCCFFWGMILWRQRQILQRFGNCLGYALPIVLLSVIWFQRNATLEAWLPAAIDPAWFDVYVLAVIEFFSAAIVFHIFMRFFNQESALARYMSDASYTIYLFHALGILLIAGPLTRVPISIFLKFPIVVGLVTLISLAFHEFLVRRFGLFALLLNGKLPAGRRVTTPPVMGQPAV
jgi:glucan biosynthesis protein C